MANYEITLVLRTRKRWVDSSVARAQVSVQRIGEIFKLLPSMVFNPILSCVTEAKKCILETT